MNSPPEQSGYHIDIRGRVQGVGFRPFIYRLASNIGLKGYVYNHSSGVSIKLNSDEYTVRHFIQEVYNNAPDIAEIESINYMHSELEAIDNFYIRKSKNLKETRTEICPDIAVCKECLIDMQNQDRRIAYPLINCTNCGPRYSITKALPYDRPGTSMNEFQMCPDCEDEYKDPLNRRFHAQPVACNYCGPNYRFETGSDIITDPDVILETAAKLIEQGLIGAIKGLGGYHLVCDAHKQMAIQKLRKRKKREQKPLAVMFRDIPAIRQYCDLSSKEEALLLNWRSPILLLKDKGKLPVELNEGLNYLGAILPYQAFHHLLFSSLKGDAIVLTSANISNEPILSSGTEINENLSEVKDFTVSYNRKIVNKLDDSVAFCFNSKLHLIRRSRGFVPEAIRLNFNCDGILALGSDLKNSFCVGKGSNAILSPHIGDLSNPKNFMLMEEVLKQFQDLFDFKTNSIACDLHPHYESNRYAQSLTTKIDYIQHHHAHIASVMAEHHLDEQIIGLSMDGTGYGTDGKIWGSEALICDLNTFERIFHLSYLTLPGGEKAISEPWRIAIWALMECKQPVEFIQQQEFLQAIPKHKIRLVIESIKTRTGLTESCGIARLFDLVAALLNITISRHYEGEGPMKLEAMTLANRHESYSFCLKPEINIVPIINQIVEDISLKVSTSIISTRLHNTIVNIITEMAIDIKETKKITKVALSGGMFQNRYILNAVYSKLRKNGLQVFLNEKVPANDGGLALGQIAVAAKRRSLACV
jgi:hydrogenase maturation protein HypF